MANSFDPAQSAEFSEALYGKMEALVEGLDGEDKKKANEIKLGLFALKKVLKKYFK
tara:strand:+ start:1261 stop:1428 length:168 start_codon:yes stop_codon:yes gene_type:complete